MVPTDFANYFLASAGAGAALIGLLFVAISINTGRTFGRAAQPVRQQVASGAFDLAIEPEDTSDPQRATDRYRGLAGPWFDALAGAATAGPDRSEKRLLYSELEQAWDAARPALPLYQRLQVDVAPRALAGVDPASAGAPLTWNAREWRFAVH